MTAPRTAKKAAAKPVTLRDRLAKKRAKIVTEYFPLDEAGEVAVEALDRAQRYLDIAEAMKSRQGDKSDVDVPTLKKERDEAAAERNKTCLALQFRGLSEDAQDALASSYDFEDPDDKATDEETKAIEAANLHKLQDWTYHAMEETVVDSDLTADDWREELSSGRWTTGDILRIRDAIRRAYGAQPADGIPKG